MPALLSRPEPALNAGPDRHAPDRPAPDRPAPDGSAPRPSRWTRLRTGLQIRSPPGPRHPGVGAPEHLTVGERTTDRMRNGTGSWTFVFCALAVLAGWMAVNRGSGFDPYLFILLNLLLSCLAAMQAAILLIAARRSDPISSELALHDYQINTAAARVLDQVHQELVALLAEQARLRTLLDAGGPGSR